MGAVPSTSSTLPVTTTSSLTTGLPPTTLTPTATSTPVTPTTPASAPVKTSVARYIFSFGDSFTDTGFNPAGTWASQNNPFGNPGYPGYTSCGGPNWLDYLITSAPANTLSYNYAMGGATVDNKYAHIFYGGDPFTVQATKFTGSTLAKTPHPANARWIAANSVFTIWFGVNDVDATVIQTPPDPAIVDKIMTSYFNTINQLYTAGARSFVLMGIPPLWRSPTWRNDPLLSNVTAECTTWNTILQQRLLNFKTAKPLAKAFFLDIQPFFTTVLDNPSSWGLVDGLCYNQDGISCPWKDGTHPGQAIHRSVGIGVRAFLAAKGFLPPASVSSTAVATSGPTITSKSFSSSATTLVTLTRQSTTLGAVPTFRALVAPAGYNPRQPLYDAELCFRGRCG